MQKRMPEIKKPRRVRDARASDVKTLEGVHEMNSTSKTEYRNGSGYPSNVIPFKFEAREVRTMLIDDLPWFCAADVCASLAIGNTSLAVNGRADRKGDGLDDDEKGIATVNTPSGVQQMLVVNESGLYSLIFKSRKKEAKRFQKWVTAEVLPAIRKHGSYSDANNKMGTLIGETIGTNGFNMLGALIKGKVTSLSANLQRKATAKIWSQTHAAFGVRSAADIPASQLDAARNFIAAYALEGEWLGKEKKNDDSAISLSLEEASALYVLMSNVHFAMHDAWYVNLAGIATSLSSKPLIGIAESLRQAKSPFKKIDARRVELYTAYLITNDGHAGGYAMKAAS